MSSDIWKRPSSRSAATPAHPSQDSSAARPAGGGYDGATKSSAARPAGDGYKGATKSKDGATLRCLFARLPSEIWRQLVGLLSYSDVAAWACCTSHEDTKRLLLGYMRRRCCVSTFKRLLVEYGALTPKGIAAAFLTIPEERKHFWKRAIEIIFMCEPKLLLDGKYYHRCDALIQQDYIHSCGVLFAPKACATIHRHLQRKFRAGCRDPIIAQSCYRMRGFHYCLNGLIPGTHTAGTAIFRERRYCQIAVLDSLLI